MSSVVYTFRTFPRISALKKLFPYLFIFAQLKSDIESFCHYLLKEKPDFVIGVAAAKTKSVFEPTAINNIHGHKIVASAPQKLPLFVPSHPVFTVSSKPSNSFCNYSMFKIQYFINQHQLPTKLTFIHLYSKNCLAMVKRI